ncbi:MAG: DUF929 family protein [Streptosporangiaceae bacterium]
MSKAARTRARTAQAKIAAQREHDRRIQARRRALIAAGSVIAVLGVVVALILVRAARPTAKAGPARLDASVARQVTTVPAAVFDRVGTGSATGLRAISGQALTAGGKPELLYMGGEFCPYCAAERWAIAAAVSRFGTLSGLRFIHSSPTDAYPDTPTLSFSRATFTSRYLSFVPVEWFGEASDPSTPFGHVYLQHPTRQQARLFARYAGGAIPFVDIGNRWVVPQAQYLPSTLAGMTWAQVAVAMHDPASTVGRNIDGAANMITAAICVLTHGRPGNVCHSAAVTAARGSI